MNYYKINNNININNIVKFLLVSSVSYASYILIKYFNNPIIINKSIESKIEYKSISTQTDLKNSDIENLQEMKKLIDNIDNIENGNYQWNII